MKTRNHPTRRKRTGFIALLLALFGIGTTGCIVPCMYGSPTADFTVKGKVVDESGAPISGLQVILGRRYYDSPSVIYDENYFPIDTIQTGPDGIYQYQTMNGAAFPVDNLQVDVNDIDGEAGGGAFESASLVVKKIEYDGGKGWYEGHAEIEVPDIILKKK